MLTSPSHITPMLLMVSVILLAVCLMLMVRRKNDTTRIKRWREDYAILQQQQKKMEETFRTVRAQRHDMLAHFGVLQFLIENEKWGEGKEYLQELLGEYEQTNLWLKGEEGHTASILHETYKKGTQEGINVEYDLAIPFSECPLPVIEQSKLLSNLLTNAQQAAKNFKIEAESSQKSFISLSTSSRSGLFIIEVVNTSLRIPDRILDTLYKHFEQTTKAGHHEGVGTFVIAQIVHNHHGSLDYSYANEVFTVKIKLPLLKSG